MHFRSLFSCHVFCHYYHVYSCYICHLPLSWTAGVWWQEVLSVTCSIWLPIPSLSLYGRMTPSSWMKRGGRKLSTSWDVSAALNSNHARKYVTIMEDTFPNNALRYIDTFTHLLMPWKVLLAMSMMPPVGRVRAPTKPLPTPLKKPAAPSFWAPTGTHTHSWHAY